MKENQEKWIKIVLGVVCVMCVSLAVSNSCEREGGKNNTTQTTESTTDTTESTTGTTESESVEENLATKGTAWDISTEKDEMYNSTSVWASLTSNNTSQFANSIRGDTYLKLVVRHTKKFGTDVYLQVETGQFFGSEYYGTDHINVKFDDGAVRKYKFSESSDGSSDVIFIEKAQDFISHLKKAKVILIEAPFYNEGVQRFTFYVDFPLIWDLNNIERMRDQRASAKTKKN